MTSSYSDYKAAFKVFWRLAKEAGYSGSLGSPGFPPDDVSWLMKKAWRLVKRGQES